MLQTAIALLRIASILVSYLDRKRALGEIERTQLADSALEFMAAAKLLEDVKTKVGGMTDVQIDAALERDFRP